MKHSLELKLGQHLAMTPQLQQAIRLLQLSTLDLRQEIQGMLESNPLLEEEGEEVAVAAEEGETAGNLPERQLDLSPDSPLPDELPVDSQWEDVYDLDILPSAPASEEDLPDLEARNSAPQSLQDHLRWQADLTHFTPEDRAIAEAIIDAIDVRGYLTADTEELASMLGVEPAAVLAVLKRIHHFDPPGVGARDLAECLLLQLDQLPEETPGLPLARRIAKQYLQQLARHEYGKLCQLLGVDEGGLREAVALIASLNPKPGESVSQESPEYVIPDVIVRWRGKRLKVELNQEAMPRLRINRRYARLAGGRDATHKYVQEHLTEARWFLKSLQSRQETVLKVASAIVERQKAFFEHGPEAMRPMVLRDIAEMVEMHESTISRVTNQKYMVTPRGLFEFKYFFSSHVSTESGGAASATAIRALIIKLIQAENPQNPLSDSDIAKVLSQQGVQIARRTVAKYREGENLPPASQRRRLI